MVHNVLSMVGRKSVICSMTHFACVIMCTHCVIGGKKMIFAFFAYQYSLAYCSILMYVSQINFCTVECRVYIFGSQVHAPYRAWLKYKRLIFEMMCARTVCSNGSRVVDRGYHATMSLVTLFLCISSRRMSPFLLASITSVTPRLAAFRYASS